MIIVPLKQDCRPITLAITQAGSRLTSPSQRELERPAQSWPDFRETVCAASRTPALHLAGVPAVSESRDGFGPPVNHRRVRGTAPNRAPAPFRHFLSSPCAVDKETRTPPRLSFFQAAGKMADIQVRAPGRRRGGGTLSRPRGRVLERRTRAPVWGLMPGGLDFPDINSGGGLASLN